MDADIPEHILVVMIKRGDSVVIPKGTTEIQLGDVVVLNSDQLNGE